MNRATSVVAPLHSMRIERLNLISPVFENREKMEAGSHKSPGNRVREAE
jgi:hypothetical protein